MATQRKKDVPLKEKMGTSSTTIKTKKSSTTGTATTNPSSDKKQVPNYLKPTLCSSTLIDHPTSLPKKQGISSVKPNINRRRSFDRPPSSSSTPIHSKSSHTTLRSPSPVLSKVNSLPKPYVKKILQPSSNTKTNMVMKKKSTAVKEEANCKESEQVPTEVESSKKEDDTLTVSELKEEGKPIEIDNDDLISCEVHVAENPNICEDVKECNLDDINEKPIETDNNELISSEDLEIEEVGEKAIVEEVGEQAIVEEVIIENLDEKKDEEKNMENEEVNKDDEESDNIEEDKIGNANDVDDALMVDDDVVKAEENIEINLKDGEPKTDIIEEGKENEEEKVSKVGITSGKETQQQVQYNDVIEETKNKLLEKRKNKVSALVGAFETVISLEGSDS